MKSEQDRHQSGQNSNRIKGDYIKTKPRFILRKVRNYFSKVSLHYLYWFVVNDANQREDGKLSKNSPEHVHKGGEIQLLRN